MPEFFQWLMDRRCYGATMEAAMQAAPEWAEWQRKEAQVPLFEVLK